MDVATFTTVYNPLIQTALMLIGLISILLLAYQLKQSSDWNKVNSLHTMYGLLPDMHLEKDFWAIVEKYSSADGVVSKEGAPQIRSNYEEWIIFKTYINCFERICTAINLGVIDELYAYSVLHSRMRDVKSCCHAYFEHVRSVKRDEELFIEIERALSKFDEIQARRETELKKATAKHTGTPKKKF
ncbi:DUF4760 domain-containing protein [Dyadobacter endophyticus]|uniref:DUF4760 domain-containing protein n=1 Tax=Dyadobacter TaxID=120831 RepID=UPI003CE68747